MIGVAMNINGKEYLTIAEAAKIIGKSEGYIRKLLGEKDERLSSIKIGQRLTMIPEEDVRKFAESKREPGNPQFKNQGKSKRKKKED